MKRSKKKSNNLFIKVLMLVLVIFMTYYKDTILDFIDESVASVLTVSYDLDEIPEYSGEGYVVINNNEPNFTNDDLVTYSFE